MAGFVWAVYSSDDGHDYLLKVDNDLYADTDRGWEPPVPDSYLPQYPRGWQARYVVGLGPVGERRSAILASTAAILWSDLTTVFHYRDTNGAIQSAQVIMRVAEHRLRAAPAPVEPLPLPPIP